MVDQTTLRTYGVNQVFRFVKGIWLHRKSLQSRFFFLGKDLFYFYVRNFFWATFLYKYHKNYIKLEPGVPGGAEVVVPERQLLPVHPDHVVVSN